MAKKVKFPLDMADGSQVRNIEELREHFDLTSVLGYFADGQLVEWLETRFYEKEAEAVKALDNTAPDLKKNLCDILGVAYEESEADKVDFTDVSERNERFIRLKEFTTDDKILAAVDRVAFNQEELPDLLDGDVKEIYLCGGEGSFTIPGSKIGVAYIGINNPKVTAPDDFQSKGITFQGIADLDVDNIIRRAKEAKDSKEKANLWHKAAMLGNAESQFTLGEYYFWGNNVKQDDIEAIKWYHKAAEQGYAEAQYKLGVCYGNGKSGKVDKEESVKWYSKAVEQYRKAAEKGDAKAQYNLGYCYYYGDGVDQDYNEAVMWIRKAAEQGYSEAQYELGEFYEEGIGVEENEEKALEWYHKAAKQGNTDAINALKGFDTTTYDTNNSDSILTKFVNGNLFNS